MAGLKRRKLADPNGTREDHKKHYVDCACGESVLVDGRFDKATCGHCVQTTMLSDVNKKKKR